MRTVFILFLVVSLASCKAPLPIYFTKPFGEKVTVFPEKIQGYYYSLNDIVDDGKKNVLANYFLIEGKIVRRDAMEITKTNDLQNNLVDSTEKETEQLISKDGNPSGFPEENNHFNKIAHLNISSFNYVDTLLNSIDKKSKIVFGFLKIAGDKISLIYIDSMNENHETVLFRLDEKLQLTSYLGSYYMNFKTAHGWEIIQLDNWDKGRYLNLVQFYFTDYNDKTGNKNNLLKSTRKIYPHLKPIYNSEKLIIGFKGRTRPNLLVEKFKKSEFNLVLLKTE